MIEKILNTTDISKLQNIANKANIDLKNVDAGSIFSAIKSENKDEFLKLAQQGSLSQLIPELQQKGIKPEQLLSTLSSLLKNKFNIPANIAEKFPTDLKSLIGGNKITNIPNITSQPNFATNNINGNQTTNHLVNNAETTANSAKIDTSQAPAGYRKISGNNFESGQIGAGWSTQTTKSGNGMSIENDPTGENGKVLRSTVNKSDNFAGVASGTPRSEIVNQQVRFKQGEDYMITWKTYIPEDYQFDSQQREIISQIHQSYDGGSPPFSLGLEGNNYQMWSTVSTDYNNASAHNVGNAEQDKGKWVTWSLHYKPSNGSDGIMELYKNGDMVADKNGQQNSYSGDNMSYLKLGVYKWDFQKKSSDVNTRTILYDDINIYQK